MFIPRGRGVDIIDDILDEVSQIDPGRIFQVNIPDGQSNP